MLYWSVPSEKLPSRHSTIFHLLVAKANCVSPSESNEVSRSNVQITNTRNSIFFFSRLFAAIGSQGIVLLVSFQALGLFYTGQSPDVQSPRQSALTNEGGWWCRLVPIFVRWRTHNTPKQCTCSFRRSSVQILR